MILKGGIIWIISCEKAHFHADGHQVQIKISWPWAWIWCITLLVWTWLYWLMSFCQELEEFLALSEDMFTK